MGDEECGASGRRPWARCHAYAAAVQIAVATEHQPSINRAPAEHQPSIEVPCIAVATEHQPSIDDVRLLEHRDCKRFQHHVFYDTVRPKFTLMIELVCVSYVRCY